MLRPLLSLRARHRRPLIVLLTAMVAAGSLHAEPTYHFRTPVPKLQVSTAPVVKQAHAVLVSANADVDFGLFPVNAPAPSVTWQFKNTGNAPMSLSFSGAPSAMSLQGDCAGPVAPGAVCSTAITLATRTARVIGKSPVFVSGEGAQALPSLSVMGTVYAPPVRKAQLVSGSAQLDLGSYSLGDPITWKGWVFINTGNVPMTMGVASLPAGVELMLQCENVAPNNVCTMLFTMDSSQPLVLDRAPITLTGDFAPSLTQAFTLTGSVKAP